MNILHSLWFVTALVSCSAANCCPDVCVFEDVECVTNGARNVMKAIVTGESGSTKSFDPLYLNWVEGTKGSTKYFLTNIELNGLSSCALLQASLNSSDSTYAQYIQCPKLRFKYEVREVSGPLKRINKASVTAYNYDILNVGQYGIFVSERDHQPHFFVKFILTFVEHKGKLKVESLDNSNGVATKEIVYEDNDNEKVEFLLSLIVKDAMKELINSMSDYVSSLLLGEVIPAYPQNNGTC